MCIVDKIDFIVEACPIGTIFSLLMDLSDCSTISQSEELFGYVEAQMHQWKVVGPYVQQFLCVEIY